MPQENTPPKKAVNHAVFFIVVLLAIPVSFGAALGASYLLSSFLRAVSDNWWRYESILLCVSAGSVLLFTGYGLGRFLPAPKTFFARHLPFFLPLLFGCWYVAGYLWDTGYVLNEENGECVAGAIVLAVFFFFWICYTVGSVRRERPSRVFSGIVGVVALLAVGALPAIYVQRINDLNTIRFAGDDLSYSSDENVYAQDSIGHDVSLWAYTPFGKHNYVHKPDFPVSLEIKENYPRIDGAIAVLPLYAAFAEAVYKGLDEESVTQYVACENTPTAFGLLLDGKIDIFFGVPPSETQLKTAADRGVELTVTPLAKEAFVFFVNSENPVNGLSVEQIQKIYSKDITNWKDVGGVDGPIAPFQRPEGSGSQSAMQNMVMKGKKLARPLMEEYYEGMGGIVRGVAEYRHNIHAIGYSFRWYVTALIKNPKVKLLRVDGILPTPENIADDSYIFGTNLVMITRTGDLTPEAKALFDWALGPEGQKIVNAVGYVSLEPQLYMDEKPVEKYPIEIPAARNGEESAQPND